ncbi:unnamed protein product [Ambrosiozyma monospora]|uniref:Unnamed protein product n=1 Tax=Ambrosiozyma monospora TaxID=43982 RepID=A0ACB5TM15_AMBMO|nr:unnamed protein product [Ambrosiozyma monospora]
MKHFILVTQGLPDLPPKRFISMRLLFNDHCPSYYQPELFIDCSKDEKQAKVTVLVDLAEEIEQTRFGHFCTPHHDFVSGVLSKSVLDESDQISPEGDTGLVTEQIDPFDLIDPVHMEMDDLEHHVSQITHDLKNFVTSKAPGSAAGTQLYSSQQVYQNTFPGSYAVSTIAEVQVDCECGSHDELEYSDLITCSGCSKKFHSVCYGDISKSSKPFKCISCSNGTVTDDIAIIFVLRKIAGFYKKAIVSKTGLEDYRAKMSSYKFNDVDDACTKLGYDPNNKGDIQLVLKAMTTVFFTETHLSCKEDTISDVSQIVRTCKSTMIQVTVEKMNLKLPNISNLL